MMSLSNGAAGLSADFLLENEANLLLFVRKCVKIFLFEIHTIRYLSAGA